MKKIKCKLILHGVYREIHCEHDSITHAKKWLKECWNRPYTIIKIKDNEHTKKN